MDSDTIPSKPDKVWIKLHRSIVRWEWWDDHPTRNVFQSCLLLANRTDGKWHGMTIPRGSFVTSISRLASVAGMSVQQTRTALEHLKLTHELTTETTHNYTLITVCNYEKYQGVRTPVQQTKQQDGQQAINKPPTNDKQAINMPPTNHQQAANNNKRNKEDIEEKESKKEKDISSSPNVEEDTSVGSTDTASVTGKKEGEKEPEGKMEENRAGKPEGKPERKKAPDEPDEETVKNGETINYPSLVRFWNERTKGRFGKIIDIRHDRRKMVRARIIEYGKKAFAEAVGKACASEFLAGERWFNFDWMVRPNNFQKLISGNFDNRPNQAKHGEHKSDNNLTRLGLGEVTRPSNKGVKTDI